MASAATVRSEFAGSNPPLVRGDPLVPRMLLGQRLRDLREATGLSRAEAGRTIRASRSKISRIERGRTGLRHADVAELLTAYGIRDEAERSTLLTLTDQANARPWWYGHRDVVPPWMRRYLSAEQAARLVRCFGDRHVPELLRTDAYAREVIGEQAPDRRVELLARRRRILRRRPRPVNLWVVLDEAALWRPVGDAATMRGQLEHLREISWRPNVTVQIAPFNIGGRVAAGGPLTLVRFPQQTLPDLVYLERDGEAVYPARPGEIEHHWHIFNTLVTEAAAPEHTPRIIERVLAEY
ncbi:helix-turn-helix domain-containing protein [Actinomadura viridis]|uniref:helix-turn-helix domain-containing protein n=1 Tax=Actinomadura viridis TaxID=58110 RepID=UPI00369BD8FF